MLIQKWLKLRYFKLFSNAKKEIKITISNKMKLFIKITKFYLKNLKILLLTI